MRVVEAPEDSKQRSNKSGIRQKRSVVKSLDGVDRYQLMLKAVIVERCAVTSSHVGSKQGVQPEAKSDFEHASMQAALQSVANTCGFEKDMAGFGERAIGGVVALPVALAIQGARTVCGDERIDDGRLTSLDNS